MLVNSGKSKKEHWNYFNNNKKSGKYILKTEATRYYKNITWPRKKYLMFKNSELFISFRITVMLLILFHKVSTKKKQGTVIFQ